MILNLLLISTTLHLVRSFPQNIREIQDFVSSEEVIALPQHIQHSRSINHQVEIQNFEDTVKEVEDLIQINPDLPRLTRGEILDILENITRDDEQNFVSKTQNVEDVTSKDNRDPKALMVVKAFTPLGSGELEDFYTKRPVTTIVDNEQSKEDIQESISTTQRNAYSRRKPTKGSAELKNKTVGSEKKPFRGTTQFKFETTDPTTPKFTTPNILSTTRQDVKRRRRPPVTTNIKVPTREVTTYHPRRRLPISKDPMKHSNHKYPESEQAAASTLSGQGIKIISPPNLQPSLEPSEINFELLDDLEPQEGNHKESIVPSTFKFRPTTEDYGSHVKMEATPSIEVEMPEHLKRVVANLNLASIKDPESISITSIDSGSNTSEEEKIKDILASIGVIPASSTISTTTSTDASPNAEVIADNLSPDMRDLLKSFGLLPGSGEDTFTQKENKIADYVPEKALTDPQSYVGFKPLPEDPSGRKEMEDFLAQFGLIDTNDRQAKSLKDKNINKNKMKQDNGNDDQNNLNLDVVPEEFQSVIAEMGLGKKQSRKIRDKPSENFVSSSEKPGRSTTVKQHVFNPNEQYASEHEIRKLGRLLEIMRKLEKFNGTITQDELKKIDTEELRDIVTTLNQSLVKTAIINHENAPDPLKYDYGLSKNEIKRQEGITTVVSVKAEEATTTPQEEKSPSIKDLEDSFGGSDSSGTSPATELPETEATPTTAKTGFYYLLDWNTFFEIDDQKGKRVNLRFQPKAGDPKRFYSVTVP